MFIPTEFCKISQLETPACSPMVSPMASPMVSPSASPQVPPNITRLVSRRMPPAKAHMTTPLASLHVPHFEFAFQFNIIFYFIFPKNRYDIQFRVARN